MKKMIIGNQAIAYGALEAGVEVAAGYPGTPSSEACTELLLFAENNGPAPYVEWSTNEKVAFEIAAGAAWAGKRALATMKMSGINVASDSVLSAAYSGTRGGLVIYIADDPGAEAGMPEQDTRLFAEWAGLPLLETITPTQAYEMVQFAFELSEQSELPVILRSVTSVAHAQEMVESDFTYTYEPREASFERNIFQFTKAGSAICLAQHRTLLERLEHAEKIIHDRGINTITEAKTGNSALYAVSVGSCNPIVKETLLEMEKGGNVNCLFLESSFPLDRVLVTELFEKASRIVIFEELEPAVEMLVRSEASEQHYKGTIIGKIGGHLPRVGKYNKQLISRGIASLVDPESVKPSAETPTETPGKEEEATISVKHPITFCAGCPHRGTYIALNRAIKKAGFKKNNTIVTGDIGCTILGMNPPFDSCWTEVSMGSSIGFAQGFLRASVENPVIATIGDSTFFHAGIPPLINAVQHRSDLLLIILDNGWTSMTGFQVNPGTDKQFQKEGARPVDIMKIVEAVGVDACTVIGPFDLEQATTTITEHLKKPGVRVIISREECALTKGRREPKARTFEIDPETCTFCKACLRETGCPALFVRPIKGKTVMSIDQELCTGCGLCFSCCKFDAITERTTQAGGR
jgi:indolepyruvate ferredoxin oxidoreductase, alpha subunit